jgi:hypothetical protein
MRSTAGDAGPFPILDRVNVICAEAIGLCVSNPSLMAAPILRQKPRDRSVWHW